MLDFFFQLLHRYGRDDLKQTYFPSSPPSIRWPARRSHTARFCRASSTRLFRRRLTSPNGSKTASSEPSIWIFKRLKILLPRPFDLSGVRYVGKDLSGGGRWRLSLTPNCGHSSVSSGGARPDCAGILSKVHLRWQTYQKLAH